MRRPPTRPPETRPLLPRPRPSTRALSTRLMPVKGRVDRIGWLLLHVAASTYHLLLPPSPLLLFFQPPCLPLPPLPAPTFTLLLLLLYLLLYLGIRWDDEQRRLRLKIESLTTQLREEKAMRQSEAATLKVNHAQHIKSTNKRWRDSLETAKNSHKATVWRLEKKIRELEQGVSASSSRHGGVGGLG